MFSGGIESVHCLKMGQNKTDSKKDPELWKVLTMFSYGVISEFSHNTQSVPQNGCSYGEAVHSKILHPQKKKLYWLIVMFMFWHPHITDPSKKPTSHVQYGSGNVKEKLQNKQAYTAPATVCKNK